MEHHGKVAGHRWATSGEPSSPPKMKAPPANAHSNGSPHQPTLLSGSRLLNYLTSNTHKKHQGIQPPSHHQLPLPSLLQKLSGGNKKCNSPASAVVPPLQHAQSSPVPSGSRLLHYLGRQSSNSGGTQQPSDDRAMPIPALLHSLSAEIPSYDSPASLKLPRNLDSIAPASSDDHFTYTADTTNGLRSDHSRSPAAAIDSCFDNHSSPRDFIIRHQQELAELEAELATAQSTCRARSEEAESLQQQLTAQDDVVRALKRENSRLQAEMADAKQQQAEATRQAALEQLQQAVSRLQDSLAAAQQRLAASQEEAAGLKACNKQLTLSLETAKCDAAEARDKQQQLAQQCQTAIQCLAQANAAAAMVVEENTTLQTALDGSKEAEWKLIQLLSAPGLMKLVHQEQQAHDKDRLSRYDSSVSAMLVEVEEGEFAILGGRLDDKSDVKTMQMPSLEEIQGMSPEAVQYWNSVLNELARQNTTST